MTKYLKNWFSNMQPFDSPLVENGISYRTPEHYYQAMKMCSKEHQEMIAQARTGYLAKKLGQTLPARPSWETQKVLVMRIAQEYRFQEGTTWREKLMKTEGEIVETNNWHDNFWGDCVCEKCKYTTGLNMLGKVLMEIRESIKGGN